MTWLHGSDDRVQLSAPTGLEEGEVKSINLGDGVIRC
jgi:hypothetical protein